MAAKQGRGRASEDGRSRHCPYLDTINRWPVCLFTEPTLPTMYPYKRYSSLLFCTLQERSWLRLREVMLDIALPHQRVRLSHMRQVLPRWVGHCAFISVLPETWVCTRVGFNVLLCVSFQAEVSSRMLTHTVSSLPTMCSSTCTPSSSTAYQTTMRSSTLPWRTSRWEKGRLPKPHHHIRLYHH